MGKEEDLKTKLFQAVINYVRDNHADEIDQAYEYFWDRNQPDEFLAGTALELGFINFEDWLVFDYRNKGTKEGFIDIYTAARGITGEEADLLQKLKGSVLSLYEVESVSKDKRMRLRDVLLKNEVSLKERTLTRGLKKGDIFATRILQLDGNQVMSGCAYPYSVDQKKVVLERIEIEFGRYIRNVNPQGDMGNYLKEYGDIFNLIWMDIILNPPFKTV